jgi:16S rRNA (cytidine1402-2'-O)-methyltransferase
LSILFLVATPIGNLEDMSPRAVRILKEVTLIAAEDTRHSRKLLTHFEIDTPLTSFFEFTKPKKLKLVIDKLNHGDVALISDAGMPAINDPGYQLVQAALEAGHEVSPVPGPSAPIAALVSSGLPTDEFIYMGYPPRKTKERQQFFNDLAQQSQTLVFLESPHRLIASLKDALLILGDREIAVAAELTKRFERFYRGQLQEAIAHFESEKIRGEFTLVMRGALSQSTIWPQNQMQVAIQQAFLDKLAPSQLAKDLAIDSGWKKGDVYSLIMKIQDSKAEAE